MVIKSIVILWIFSALIKARNFKFFYFNYHFETLIQLFFSGPQFPLSTLDPQLNIVTEAITLSESILLEKCTLAEEW